MKVVHCPIDTSLNFTQAKKLLRDTRPNTLVIPHRYTQPPASAPARQDLVIDVDITTLTFQKNDIIKIPLVRKLGMLLLLLLLCCTEQIANCITVNVLKSVYCSLVPSFSYIQYYNINCQKIIDFLQFNSRPCCGSLDLVPGHARNSRWSRYKFSLQALQQQHTQLPQWVHQ